MSPLMMMMMMMIILIILLKFTVCYKVLLMELLCEVFGRKNVHVRVCVGLDRAR